MLKNMELTCKFRLGWKAKGNLVFCRIIFTCLESFLWQRETQEFSAFCCYIYLPPGYLCSGCEMTFSQLLPTSGFSSEISLIILVFLKKKFFFNCLEFCESLITNSLFLEVVGRVIPAHHQGELFHYVAIVPPIITEEAFWMNGETSASTVFSGLWALFSYFGWSCDLILTVISHVRCEITAPPHSREGAL